MKYQKMTKQIVRPNKGKKTLSLKEYIIPESTKINIVHHGQGSHQAEKNQNNINKQLSETVISSIQIIYKAKT